MADFGCRFSDGTLHSMPDGCFSWSSLFYWAIALHVQWLLLGRGFLWWDFAAHAFGLYFSSSYSVKQLHSKHNSCLSTSILWRNIVYQALWLLFCVFYRRRVCDENCTPCLVAAHFGHRFSAINCAPSLMAAFWSMFCVMANCTPSLMVVFFVMAFSVAFSYEQIALQAWWLHVGHRFCDE